MYVQPKALGYTAWVYKTNFSKPCLIEAICQDVLYGS